MSSAPQKQAVEEPVMQTQETPRAPPPQAWGRGLPIQQEMAARAQAAAVNQDQIQQPVVAPTVPVSTPNTKGLEKATAKLSVSNDEGGFQSNAVNENKGPKSWADIARPEGGDVEVAGPEIGGPTGSGDANTSNINDPETGASAGRTGLNDSQQQRGGGSGTRRGGRGGQGNNGSNVASNRGRLNANQMQGQAQKLAAAQQIAVQAVQYGIDPVVYQAQLASMYGFPPDVPLGFGQFGPSPNPQQDDRAYPFLEFFRMYPHLTLVNQTTAIDPRITAEAHYFVVRVSCEQEMHRMLKYSVWTGKDSLSIQQLHGCFVNSAGPHGPNGPPSRRVFLFFYVTSVNRVAGLAEMMSPLMPSRHVPGDVEFLLQWVFAKDVPEGDFPREANLATKAAASSKGAEKKQQQTTTTTTSEQSVSDNQTGPQEVVMSLPSQIGQHCIHVVIEKPLSTSVLMNFKFFDQAELYGQNVVDSQSSGNQKSRGGVGGQGGRGRGANRNGHNNSNANSGKSNRGGVARSGSRGGAARGGDSDGRRAQRGGQSGGRGQGRGGSRGRGGGALGERSGRSGRSDGGGTQDFGRRQVEGIDGRAQLGGAFQFEIQHKVKQDKKKKKKKGSDEEQVDTPANEGDAAAAATEQQ